MIIGICDDDKVWHRQAKHILQEYMRETEQELEFIHFFTGKEVMEYEGLPVDVMFMDIELGEANGIDVVQMINQKWETCQIVYLTNYLSYALDVYHTEHSFYVLKEQFSKRIGMVFEKIRKNREQGRKQLVFSVMGNAKNVILAPEEILYFERTGRVTRLETVWGKYTLHEKLDLIMAWLPENDFIRCHNSYIVYLPAVKEFSKGTFRMKNGYEIVISRSYLKSVKTAFTKWSLAQLS